MLARTFAAETATTNVRVNLFSPGPIRTRMLATAMPGLDMSNVEKPDKVAREDRRAVPAERDRDRQVLRASPARKLAGIPQARVGSARYCGRVTRQPITSASARHSRRQQERRAGQIEAVLGRDGAGIAHREEDRADHVGDPHQARIGALQLALLVRPRRACVISAWIAAPPRPQSARIRDADPEHDLRSARARRRANPATPKASPVISAARSPKRCDEAADQPALHDHACRRR